MASPELTHVLASLTETPHEELPAPSGNSVKFKAVDPNTGSAVPHCPYIVTHADGAQHGGLTDSTGLTQEINTSEAQKVAVHFLFASALEDNVDISELVT